MAEEAVPMAPILLAAQDRLQSAYLEASGSPALQPASEGTSGALPDILALLLQLVMSLLGGCGGTAAKNTATSHPILARMYVRRALVESGEARRSDKLVLINAVMIAAKNSTAAEMDQFKLAVDI